MEPREDPNNLVFGKHVTYFEEPDIIFMALVGDVSDAEGLELLRRQKAYAEGKKMLFFLMEGRQMAGISPAARKAVAETLKQIPLYGMAIFEAPLKARVVAKLVITAINLAARAFRDDPSTNKIEFFPSEEEARQWIAGRREKYKDVLA
ncbi:MAG TPA: hypothetical protein VEW48_04880 [Thermoanaerobaculia bacterium]|nr:hypothetical protein [Thermoanaerobaculia bacterium]